MPDTFHRPHGAARARHATACTAALVLTASAAALPPAAPSTPVTERMHGVSVADPYRHLEDRRDPQTLDRPMHTATCGC